MPRPAILGAHVVNVASTVFRRVGYADASMDAIAREASVSKATLYRYYPSKEALFGAVLSELPVARFAPRADLEGNPRDALDTLARTILEALLDPVYQDLLQVALAERARFPTVAAELWDRIVGRGVRLMTEFFEREITRGSLRKLDPALAAQEFVGMLLANGLLRRMATTVPQQDVDLVVRQAVDVFLTGAEHR